MKNILMVLLIAGMIISCSTSKSATTYYSASDGKSYETAVLINERTEKKALMPSTPGSTSTGQTIMSCSRS